MSDSDVSDAGLISLFIADSELGSGISLQNHVKGTGKKHQESPTLKKRANGVSQQHVSFFMLLHNYQLLLLCNEIVCVTIYTVL